MTDETTWKTFYLSSPEIVLSYPNVYRNGRQQARLDLFMKVTRDNEDHRLTDAERDSIRLVEYGDDQSVLPLDGKAPASAPRGWSSQTVDLGYEHADARATSRSARSGEQLVTRWVTAEADAGSIIYLAFSIVLGGTTFYTTGRCVDIDDVSHPIKELDTGRSIAVNAKRPVTFPSSAIDLAQTITEADRTYDRDVKVSIHANAGLVPIYDASFEPRSVFHWEDELPGNVNAAYTGYAVPGSTDLIWGTDIDVANRPTRLERPEPDKVVIKVCGRTTINFSGHENLPRDTMRMTLTDAYGTDQVYDISFVAGKGQFGRLEVV